MNKISTLTLRCDQETVDYIEEIKEKKNISAATQAIYYSLERCLTLEDEVLKLKKENNELQSKLSAAIIAWRSINRGVLFFNNLDKNESG